MHNRILKNLRKSTTAGQDCLHFAGSLFLLAQSPALLHTMVQRKQLPGGMDMQHNPDMAALLQLAQSPAMQKLMQLMQHSGGEPLQEAMDKASAGDYTQAKRILTELLDSEEAKSLLAQLGGQP